MPVYVNGAEQLGPVSSTFTVAANDAKNKSRSDYQCGASADHTEINNAINALPT